MLGNASERSSPLSSASERSNSSRNALDISGRSSSSLPLLITTNTASHRTRRTLCLFLGFFVAFFYTGSTIIQSMFPAWSYSHYWEESRHWNVVQQYGREQRQPDRTSHPDEQAWSHDEDYQASDSADYADASRTSSRTGNKTTALFSSVSTRDHDDKRSPSSLLRTRHVVPKTRRLPHTSLAGREQPLYADLIHEGRSGSYWLPRPPSHPIQGYELRNVSSSSSASRFYGNRTGFVAPTHVNIVMYDGVWFDSYEGFNAGDFVAYFASPLIAGRPALMTGLEPGRQRTLAQGGLAVVGSIMHFGPRYSWGPGMIQEPGGASGRLMEQTERVFAMRGPKSYRQMSSERNDGSIPAVWGDLGSLVAWFYQPHDVVKRWNLCIIPHYVDVDAPFLNKLKGEWKNATNSSLAVLDIRGSITSLMNDIVRCEFILSSSLHGIIFADSYDVPNAHLEFSDMVFGKGHKFEDYFESVNRTRHILNGRDDNLANLDMATVKNWISEQKQQYRKRMNLLPFWKACPMHGVAYHGMTRSQQLAFGESWASSFDKNMHNRPQNMTQLELAMHQELGISTDLIPMQFDARRRR